MKIKIYFLLRRYHIGQEEIYKHEIVVLISGVLAALAWDCFSD